ncbi:hypothetical protein CDL12_24749 [Handroanthus impetiginosus]|uniref:DUF6817 domain-containing protein n=1 Tax=Handroanthus impetiginosus TaxID=429701 RepID=A0A2G9GBR1_9LAMI|nr:hypothetical protein CDL12_24749 [Handroanthus impetiginosus]
MSPSSSSLPFTHSDDQKNSTDADHHHLERLLASARPFLRGELEAVDENLPRLMSVLSAAGAGECWHKHGSFLDHLLGVYRILKMWKAPDVVCLCGLFHSAYSNSYVNLAIFPPSSAGRDTVRAHVGLAAERLIHLFCVVPRQPLIHDFLLFKYSDPELSEHLRLSEISLNKIRKEEEEEVEENENWRVKLQSLCPAEGIKVKHIKTGEDVLVSRRLVAVFLLMTMADFSDQLFSFQDVLFENSDGRLEFSGSNTLTPLWPGDGKPGLWMNSVSRMAAIYTLIVREEEIFRSLEKKHGRALTPDRDEDLELVIPPVFEGCTRVLGAKDHIEARDLYWEAVCNASEMGLEMAEEKLLRSVEKNPFVGEAHVVLGQIYLAKESFEAAEKAAERGLRLIMEWGSPWDKRTTWQGWIAWGRVLLMKAKERSWPQNSWGILNLGLVR